MTRRRADHRRLVLLLLAALIYRRKGPRQGRAEIPPITDVDKLGRRIRWSMPGGVRTARAQRHLIVELDGDVKTYRRAR